jgi:Fe-S cluster assembly ATPase SufC
MENNILTSSQIMEQLVLNINSLCEMFDEGDSPLDINTYKQLTNSIKSVMATILLMLKLVTILIIVM